MRVALLQIAMDDAESKDERVARVTSEIRALPPFDLLVLPELWNVGYFAWDAYSRDAEPIDGPTAQALAAVARERAAFILGGSIVERREGRLHNTALLFNDSGAMVASYRKMHLFGYESREQQLLSPGGDVIVADMPWGRMGITTCYDLRFPELYRRMVDDGATFFLVPAAWPAARLEHWTLFTRTRAIEEQSFLVACNAAGVCHGTRLAGHSAVVDPWGTVIAQAGDGQEFLCADVDPSDVARNRAQFPALHDRRL